MSSSLDFGDLIFLLTSLFEMLIFCGFQTGWSSLVYVLTEEGIYSHLCIETDAESNGTLAMEVSPNKTLNNCPAQQEMLNLAYTLATSVSAMAVFPVGIAVDAVGPRIVRIISGIMLGLASLLLSFLDKDKPEILFVGLFIACVSNLVLSMTPQTCLNRFKKGHSIIIGTYSGAWVLSSLTFLVFKIIYEQGGVRFAHFFRFLAVSCIFLCINAALLYPNKIHVNIKTKNTKEKLKNIFKTQKLQFRDTLERCKLCLKHMDVEKNECPNENCDLLETTHSDFQIVENYPNSTDKMTSTDVSKLSSNDFSSNPASCTNINCLKTVSCTSEKDDNKEEMDKIDSQEMELVKSCRKPDIQTWTALSAEAYLRSGLSYKSCALSAVHIWGELFLVACKIRLWFYVGTFSNHINDLSGGNRQTVTEYVNLFGLSQLTALLFGPLFGYIIDRRSRRGNKEYVSPSSDTEKRHQKFMMGIEDSTKAVDFIIKCNKEKIFNLNDAILMSACSAIVFCLLTLVPNLTVQIVTFQFYTFLRVAYNALFASVLIIIFPAHHLGKLMGLASLVGAIFSLVQYPLFIIMEEWFGGRLLEVNILLWLSCMVTFGLPIYLWRRATRHDPDCLTLVAV